MFVLPLVINSRRINYLSLKKNSAIARQEAFVIELPQNDGTPFTLFSIEKANLLHTLERGDKDTVLRNFSFDCSLENNELRVVIGPSKTTAQHTSDDDDDDDEAPTVTKTAEQQRFVWDALEFEVVNTKDIFKVSGRWKASTLAQVLANDQLTCFFEFQSQQINYSASCHFFLAHVSKFLQIGLDFGSEASQLAISSYTKGMGTFKPRKERVNLFDSLKAYLNQTASDEDYIQFEQDSDLVKSVFFLKKQLEGFDTDSEDFLSDDTDLTFLLKDNDLTSHFTNENHQLVNLKLAHKHSELIKFMRFEMLAPNGRKQPKTLTELKRQVYSSVLRTLIQATFEHKLTFKTDSYIRFVVLVPNIYTVDEVLMTQETVSKILEQLQQDFQLKAWEVVTLSESDAAFLGYYNKGLRRIEPNNYYITIDCGKGTTDFSFIQTHEKFNNEIRSLYRNGFAGAGNLISYAFFEVIIQFIIQNADSPQKAKAFFESTIEQTEKFELNRLFKKIEQLKFSYQAETAQKQIENNWNTVSYGDFTFKNFTNTAPSIATLFGLINQVSAVYDWGGYIEQACETIASNIVENIKYVVNNIDKKIVCGGILLTGRGFLFAPLREKLQTKLEAEVGLSKQLIQIPTTDAEYKSVCLDGIFVSNYVTHPELVGFPITIDLAPNPTAKRWKLVDFLHQLTRSTNFDERSNNYKIQEVANKKFLMGNTLYTIKENEFARSGSANLLFTKEGFFIRRNNAQGLLEDYSTLIENSEMDEATHRLIVPSLFPAKIDKNYIEALKKDFVPPMKDAMEEKISGLLL